MRVTNGMMQRATLSQMQASMQRIAEAERKVATGMRISKASDDPTAAAGSIRTRVELRAVERYSRSADLANSRAVTEENVLLQITDLLSRAKVLANGQATESATGDTRKHAKAEVDQLFRQLVDLGNSRFESGYLFGGVQADTRPLSVDETNPVLDFVSTSPSGQHTVEIGEQRYLATNHNAVEVFETTGVLAAVRDLAAGLQNDDTAAITASMGALDTAFSGVQDLIGDIGARVNQIEVTKTSFASLELNLKQFKAGLEEVNFEEAATELVSRQTALQAAMLATSRVMGLSLADYLR